MLIRTTDVLYLMFDELCTDARRLNPWQADERVRWFDQVQQILEQVSDDTQRMAWAYTLSKAFTSTLPGVPVEVVLDWLRSERA
jgi:hypothetical protein